MIIADPALLWGFAAPRVGALRRGAVRSEWLVLYKRCNAVAEAHRNALRVDLSVPMDIVA